MRRQTAPSPGPPGRPLKFTAAVRESIIKDLRAGLPRGYACQRAGVHPNCFAQWVRRSQEKTWPNSSAYRGFYEEVQKAEADALAASLLKHRQVANGGLTRTKTHTRTIKDAKGKVIETVTETTTETTLPDHKALSWYLSHKDPKHWAANRREVRELKELVRGLKEQLIKVGGVVQVTPQQEAAKALADIPLEKLERIGEILDGIDRAGGADAESGSEAGGDAEPGPASSGVAGLGDAEGGGGGRDGENVLPDVSPPGVVTGGEG